MVTFSFFNPILQILKVSISCKGILYSHDKKSIIFILYVYEDLSSNNGTYSEENVDHLPIQLMMFQIEYLINQSAKILMKISQTYTIMHSYKSHFTP